MWILVSWILIYTVLQRRNKILKKLCTLCPYYVEHGKLHVHLLFVWFDSLCPNQQVFSHVRTGLSGLDQY